MPFVRSRDGTRIAFDKAGSGQPIILVDGAQWAIAPVITSYVLDDLATSPLAKES